jgi:glycosyltransferase involved in cell wall biosynthesis
MGPQDGVDGVLDAAARMVRVHGRTDVRFALLGFGDCLEELKARCTELGLDDYVHFTGRADPPMIADYLSTAEVGLSPDPLNPLNDVSTMNKTMEYMAYALPVVAYRLAETVVSAGDCAVYVQPGDTDGFCDAVLELLDDPKRRGVLGARGRRRAERELDWRPQSANYVGVYDGLFGLARPDHSDTADGGAGGNGAPAGTAFAGVDSGGNGSGREKSAGGTRAVIDLADERELERFAETRGT